MGVNFTFIGQTNYRAGGGKWWTTDGGPNDRGQNTGYTPPLPKKGPEAAQAAVPAAPSPFAAKKPDPEPEDTSPDTAEAMYKHFHADEISIRAKQMAEEAISNARYRQALANQRAEIDKVSGLRGPANTPINQLAGFNSQPNQLAGFNSPINQLTSGSYAPVLRIGDTVDQHIQVAQASGDRQHRYALSKRYRANKNKNNGVLTDARSVSMGDHMPGLGMIIVGPTDYSRPFSFKGSHPMTGTFTAGKSGRPAGNNNEDPMKRTMNRLYWSSYPTANSAAMAQGVDFDQSSAIGFA